MHEEKRSVDQQYYKKILLDGCSIEYKRLSLCLINDHYHRIPKKLLYQVHSDNHKLLMSTLYGDVDVAVSKFLEVKEKLG